MEKKLSKPYWTQYLEETEHAGEPERLEQVTFQVGWLSPGKQIERLIEAGDRLDKYKDENYDEFYFGDDEPSLDPIRTAEDLQDELLYAKQATERAKKAEQKIKEAYQKAAEKEQEKIKEKELSTKKDTPEINAKTDQSKGANTNKKTE